MSLRRGKAVIFVALAVAIVLGVSCVQDPPHSSLPPCTADPECPTGQRCMSDHCVANAPGDQMFSAELFAPDVRSPTCPVDQTCPTLPRAEVADLTIGAGGEAD